MQLGAVFFSLLELPKNTAEHIIWLIIFFVSAEQNKQYLDYISNLQAATLHYEHFFKAYAALS